MPITDEKYVSFTTLRKNGTPVSSPVWIAPLGDGTAGFTTDATSGKVKRVRKNAQVTLRPCTSRGKVAPGDGLDLEGDRLRRDRVDGLAEHRERHPGVEQRPEQHVPRDPRRGVDPGVPHAVSVPGRAGAAIWAARWPAP